MEKYQLEFSDGYYITRDGEGFIDGFAARVSDDDIRALCDLLNAAARGPQPEDPSRPAVDFDDWWENGGTLEIDEKGKDEITKHI